MKRGAIRVQSDFENVVAAQRFGSRRRWQRPPREDSHLESADRFLNVAGVDASRRNRFQAPQQAVHAPWTLQFAGPRFRRSQSKRAFPRSGGTEDGQKGPVHFALHIAYATPRGELSRYTDDGRFQRGYEGAGEGERQENA